MRNISGLPVIIICFPGTGDGYVQLAVDDGSVFYETVAGKEIELPDVLDGETVDDDISLAALVPLYGIDTDFSSSGMPSFSMPLRTMAIWLR